MPRLRCVLVGNYGAKNLGDEALCTSITAAFSDVDWRVVSASQAGSSFIPRLPFGIRSFFRPWWKTVSAIASADAVIFGGGTLFTDSESIAACGMWSLYACVALVFRTPYFLAFQGVGPFRSLLGRRIAQWVFCHASGITVRDHLSWERVSSWKLCVSPVQTADPALTIFSQVQRRSSDHDSHRILAVIPRPAAGSEFFELFRRRIEGGWHSIRIFLLEGSTAEYQCADRLKNIAGATSCVVLVPRDCTSFLQALGECHEVLSMRYHGALAALALRLPFSVVSQKPGDKLSTTTMMTLDQALQEIKHGERALRSFFDSLGKAGASAIPSVA